MLLLGHVLGDFYFEHERLNERKRKCIRYLLLHGCVYMVCVGGVLCIAALPSWDRLLLILFAGITHLAIDACKPRLPWKPFIFSQLLHFIALGTAWAVWGVNMQVRGFVLSAFALVPSRPAVTLILGLLWLLKPVGLLIGNGEIWDFNKSAPGESQKGAGRMIGYLERTIAFMLLLNGQYSAIGFIIAAKSMIRFPEISKSASEPNANHPQEISQSSSMRKGNSLAEYYLIGTLLSMLSAFAVYLFMT